jgi:hypothetical protein
MEMSTPLRVVIKTTWYRPSRGSKTIVETAHVATPIRGKIVIESAIVERIFPVK